MGQLNNDDHGYRSPPSDDFQKISPTGHELMARYHFSPALPRRPPLTAGDGLVLLAIASMLYLADRFAFHAPHVIAGPDINLEPASLPWYAILSLGRMATAYVLALFFSLAYGYTAARHRNAAKVLMPMLDVLQSVPILSFLPVVLLGLTAVLPVSLAVELASIALIFTSQVWNMAFSVYQSMSTLPQDLREASAVFGLGRWLRFKHLELPFAASGLIWNSMMSWAGGWFFLMAAEMFTVGSRDYRLPGLGSYLQMAANQGNVHAVLLGVGTLVAIIFLLDQLIWRPVLAWTDRFKLEMVEGQVAPTSWLSEMLRMSWLIGLWNERVWQRAMERLDRRLQPGRAPREAIEPPEAAPQKRWMWLAIGFIPLAWGGVRAAQLLATLPMAAWFEIAGGLSATFLRVTAALLVALAWTVPVGVAIGLHPRFAAIFQPVIQVVASVPATALFPVLLVVLVNLPGGLDLSAVALMILGTQWYLLFNVIAGARAIPQDLRDMAALLRLKRQERWRVLLLPSLFPFLVTGAITAAGGAWNASIVAEYVDFGGRVHSTTGIGALIARATGRGDYAMVLAATLALVLAVVIINRLFWFRLYRLAERRWRVE